MYYYIIQVNIYLNVITFVAPVVAAASSAVWIIILIAVLVLMLLILAAIFVVRHNRGQKYPGKYY